MNDVSFACHSALTEAIFVYGESLLQVVRVHLDCGLKGNARHWNNHPPCAACGKYCQATPPVVLLTGNPHHERESDLSEPWE